MSDEAAFLRAIRENPGDLALRLVYADWLDERGDPRAEYLRLKVRLVEATARLTELGEQLDPAWLAAARGPSTGNGALKLRSGRPIRLAHLQQWPVYAALLEGLPTTEMNRRHIDDVLTDERTRLGEEPYLIRPEERPIEYRGDRPYPFGSPAALPEIVCVARFNSSQPARDQSRDGSGLTVVWFQDEYAFPIDPVVREQIRAIDWERHATDFDW